MGRFFFVAAVCITAAVGLPPRVLGQFSDGDRLSVVTDHAVVMRGEDEVDKLPRGTVVVVRGTSRNDSGLWVKVDHPKTQWGWVGAEDLARFLKGDRLLVTNHDTQILKNTNVIGKLARGTIVVASDLMRNDDGMWVKIDQPKNGAGWVHEENLTRDGFVKMVRLDERVKAVVVKKYYVTLAENSETVIEETVRVRHSVSIVERRKEESGLKTTSKVGVVVPVGPAVASAFVMVETEIRKEIEKTTGKNSGVESEQKRRVTVHGARPVRVIWEDHYRTGTTSILVDGKEHEVPFEYKEGFGLRTEKDDDKEIPPPQLPKVGGAELRDEIEALRKEVDRLGAFQKLPKIGGAELRDEIKALRKEVDRLGAFQKIRFSDPSPLDEKTFPLWSILALGAGATLIASLLINVLLIRRQRAGQFEPH